MFHLFLLSFIVLSVDSPFLLSFGSGPFLRMVQKIQKEKPVVNLYSAAVAYIFIIFILHRFVIHKLSFFDSFLLGAAIYGIFDFTNLALFKNYNLYIAICDTLWGGILFASSHYIYTLF